MTGTDLIVIAGAPGVGKSTLCASLKTMLDAPYMEFSNFRSPHLDPLWQRANEREHDMAFENLVHVILNYFKYGYRNVIVTDLVDERLAEIAEIFANHEFRIFTLVLNDEKEHRQRLNRRTSGFRDVDRAIEWNRKVSTRGLHRNETRVDVAGLGPEDVSRHILKRLALG